MLERVLNVLVCLVLSYSSKEERGFGVSEGTRTLCKT